MPNLRLPAQRLFDGADSGHYGLPADLAELRTALVRLAAAPRPAFPSESDATQRLVAATVAAARDGASEWPTAEGVLVARREAEGAGLLHQARQAALERLTGELSSAVVDLGDVIVADYLRPAHDEAVSKVSAALEATAPYGDSDAALLRAPEKARKAWLTIDGHAGQYIAVDTARSALMQVGYRPQRDVEQEFGRVRNMDRLFPRARRAMIGARPPWPSGGRDQLAWFLRNNADLWCPTVSEQDARYVEVYAEAEARMAWSRQNAAAVRAWGDAR